MEVLHPSVKDVPVVVPSPRNVMFGYVVQHQNLVVPLQLDREILLVELAKKKDVVQEKGVADEIVLDVTVSTDLKPSTLTDLCTKRSRLWTTGFLSINESRLSIPIKFTIPLIWADGLMFSGQVQQFVTKVENLIGNHGFPKWVWKDRWYIVGCLIIQIRDKDRTWIASSFS